jgi:hypothetical protein
MGMHQREQIVGREGQLSSQEPVEDHSQRIEIGSVVDDPVHAPGLFG